MRFPTEDKINFINIAQRPQDVRLLQHYLRGISFYNTDVYRVNVDGIYGPETQKAVADVKRIYGIPGEANVVDNQTWDAIFSIYSYYLKQNQPGSPIYPAMHPQMLEQPDESLIIILQAMLNVILSTHSYHNYTPIPITGKYDEATRNGVILVQKTYSIPANGKLDINTWNALTHAYNHTLTEQVR